MTENFIDGCNFEQHLCTVDNNIFGTALEKTNSILFEFFESSIYEQKIDEIFGSAGTNKEKFIERRDNLKENLEKLDLLNRVISLSSEMMGNAYGAFTGEGGNGEVPTIFVNTDWASNKSVDSITGVLLEEVGHAIDYLLNKDLDSSGDEGELFSRSLLEIPITKEDKERILEEDDDILVSYQGRTLTAEAALTSVSSTTGTRVGTTRYGHGNHITFDPITIVNPTGSVLLNVNAYDVDFPAEIDSVFISGPATGGFVYAGALNGFNNQWTWTTLDITSIATVGGSYQVQIRPDEDQLGNNPDSAGWVVASRYADITTGTTNGYITDLLLNSAGGVSSDITVDTTGSYIPNYYLIDSGRTVRATFNENVSLTNGVTYNNGPDTLSGWGSVGDGNYTLRAVLTTSGGSTIRDIDTWTIVKSGSSVSTTPDSDTPPTVTITNSDNALKIGDTSTVNFTFNEDIQNFDLSDVSAENGTLSD